MALGRGIAAAACVGALSLAALGCGAEEHPNEPRPSAASRVSVAINDDGISVRARFPDTATAGPLVTSVVDDIVARARAAVPTASDTAPASV